MEDVGITYDKNAAPPWVREVRQLILPPRRICREGRHYKLYLPAELAPVFEALAKSGKKLAGVLYIVD